MTKPTFRGKLCQTRPKLYRYAIELDRDIEIIDVKKFFKKHKCRVVCATLFSEYMKASKVQWETNAIDPNKKIPTDILYKIINFNNNY
jgi:hypothetical protein